MARFAVHFISAAAFISATLACRCFPPDFETSFYRGEESGMPFTTAFVLNRQDPVDQFGKVSYTLYVTKVYSGCTTTEFSIVSAETSGSSAACGVKLELFTQYLLPLKKDGTISQINSCQIIRKFDELTEKELKFLNTRTLCCKNECVCAGGQKPFYCKRICGPSPDCDDADVCKLNFCAGCVPEWFTKKGLPACKKSPY